LLFVAGLVPPRFLRQLWRRPEQERLREAVVGLMRGQTRDEIVREFVPFVGPVVGASAAELVDPDGRTMARWGAMPEGDVRAGLRRLGLPLASVELAVWSGPQTPFFGRDELELLRSTGTVLELALERADLLERERATIERLEELDDLKNTFLSAVSHELRTPLAVILGSALTLEARRKEMKEGDVAALLSSLAVASRKLDRLLADLLDLDRLTRGAVAVQRQRTDLGELVRRVVAELGMDGRRVAFEGNGVVADVDPAKTERIVENLVANAVRHTPKDVPVWVRTRAESGAAVVEVEDAGPGVPPELREAIFEPFRRGSAQYTPGTGIGLTLVRRFADLHGGSAWVEEREGGGARFCVRLPYEAATSTR
jgi:signal transduction histidine kinase